MENGKSPGKTFDIRQRTLKFAILIVNLITQLPKNAAGFAIANQLVRSGTSIGANVEEAQDASTKKEFIRCLTISLKEARETEYWLTIIDQTELLKNPELVDALQEANELVKILTTIVKRSKLNNS